MFITFELSKKSINNEILSLIKTLNTFEILPHTKQI
jgi:hypothetical protein